MNKSIVFVLIISLGLMSCGKESEDSATNEKMEATTHKQEQKEVAKPQNQNSSGGGKTIIGDAVIMREGPTSESAKLRTFKKGEKVAVLDKKESSTTDEVVTIRETELLMDNSEEKVRISKGVALKLLPTNEFDEEYRFVAYKGKKAFVLGNDIQVMGIWYKVRSSDGNEGWVLDKFIK